MNDERQDKTTFSTSLIRDDKAKAYNSWLPPEMTGQAINRDVVDLRSQLAREPATAQTVEEIHQQAYDEGYAKGLETGKQEGMATLRAQIQGIHELQQAITAHATEFDQVVTDQLVQLTVAIAKQIIRRELTTNPDEIMAVVQEAMSLMPNQTDQITLKLHPDDAKLVRDIYDMQNASDISWTIFEDPTIQRGGCIITSDFAELNAELDKRIKSIVQQLLGGERSDD